MQTRKRKTRNSAAMFVDVPYLEGGGGVKGGYTGYTNLLNFSAKCVDPEFCKAKSESANSTTENTTI